jgi:hypothetical protein
MDYVRLTLKVCEACGSLWLRVSEERSSYCRGCERRLAKFPAPETRRRRGRPARRRVSGARVVAGGVR